MGIENFFSDLGRDFQRIGNTLDTHIGKPFAEEFGKFSGHVVSTTGHVLECTGEFTQNLAADILANTNDIPVIGHVAHGLAEAGKNMAESGCGVKKASDDVTAIVGQALGLPEPVVPNPGPAAAPSSPQPDSPSSSSEPAASPSEPASPPSSPAAAPNSPQPASPSSSSEPSASPSEPASPPSSPAAPPSSPQPLDLTGEGELDSSQELLSPDSPETTSSSSSESEKGEAPSFPKEQAELEESLTPQEEAEIFNTPDPVPGDIFAGSNISF